MRMATVSIRDYNQQIASVATCLDDVGLVPSLVSGARVFLKPNLTFPSHRPGVTTTPTFIENVVSELSRRGAAISVGEADGGYGSWPAETGFLGHDLPSICQRYRTDLVNLSACPAVPIEMSLCGRQMVLDLPRILVEETDIFIT